MRIPFKPLGLLIAALLLMSGSSIFAEDRATTEITLEGKAVSINYGRPTLRGRDLNQLIEVAHVWRLGMNQATTLSTKGDLKFGALDVPQGSYSLFAKKTGVEAWDLIINTQTGQWGTQRDASKDLGSVPLTVDQGTESVEQFTIELSPGGKFSMSWGTLRVSVSFTAN